MPENIDRRDFAAELERNPNIIVSPRDSYMIMLLLAAAIAGWAGFFTGGTGAQAVEQQLGFGRYVWYAGLAIGGTLSLAMVLRGKSAVALMWERVGLLLLSGVLFAFGTAYIGINAYNIFSLPVACVGSLVVVFFLWKKKLLTAVLIAAATLLAMGAQGSLIIFGFAVANLDRIRKINFTLTQLYADNAMDRAQCDRKSE